MSGVVEAWFGRAYAELHPLLQALHRDGGVLTGPVQIAFGTGLAGMLGRRIARRTGIPADGLPHRLRVAIHSAQGVLHWTRSFDGNAGFASAFTPVGNYPDGHWQEAAGGMRLRLGVAIIAGGWHWQHLGGSIGVFVLPRWAMPRLQASKVIEGGRYRFAVRLWLPLLGTLLAYNGAMTPEPVTR